MSCSYPKHLNLKVDDETFASLLAVSDEEGFSMSAIVRHLIKRYLRERSILNGTHTN